LRSRQELVSVELLPDESSGANENFCRSSTQELPNLLGGGMGGLETLGSGIAIRAAGVENDCPGKT
jgi:hypothetical protein